MTWVINNSKSGSGSVQVQSDWAQSNNAKLDYIKNKPTIPIKTSQLSNDSNFITDVLYIHTDNNFTTSLKTSYDNAVTKTHEHSNKALLDNIISTGDGTKYLADDGTYKTVSGGTGTGPGDMTKAVYDTNNNGIVDKASQIDGVLTSSPLTYYGKNSTGDVGFHSFPLGATGGVNQAVKLAVTANTTYTLDLSPEKPNNDLIVQCYKFVSGTSNVTQVLKDFSNADSSNFYFNSDGVTFDGVMKQKNSFDYAGTVVDVSNFIDISSFTIV